MTLFLEEPQARVYPGLHPFFDSGCLASSQIPAITSTVPAATHAVNGSPSSKTAIRIVDSGPMFH